MQTPPRVLETVPFIPNLEEGELEATVLLRIGDYVVLNYQGRICKAALDGDIYRPIDTVVYDLHQLLDFGHFRTTRLI
jgi:hypothetical protein